MRSSSIGLKEFKGEHAFFKKLKKIFYLLASEHLFTTSNANASAHTPTLATSGGCDSQQGKELQQASKQRTNKQTIVIINNNNSNNNNNNNK